MTTILPSTVIAVSQIDKGHDGIIIVSHSLELVKAHPVLNIFYPALSEYNKVNDIETGISCTLILVSPEVHSSRRLVFSNPGSIDEDFDDVRKFKTASVKATQMALQAGAKNALLATLCDTTFENALLVSALGALHALYIPLTVRERKHNKKTMDTLSIFTDKDTALLTKQLNGFNKASILTRDLGDADPIRMTPLNIAQHVEEYFAADNNSSVKVKVERDMDILQKNYPLMMAVSRSANDVPSHRPCLIRLEYEGEKVQGKEYHTLMLVGKGVTFDSGGINLKIGPNMNGMCMDKYGSAVVAGFVALCDIWKPKGIKVVSYLPMVRNSIGSNSYTCDELIRTRSNKVLRIMNTDAEGRISMLDPLTEFVEEAIHEINPHLMTLATLTGHAVMSHGDYAAIMDNGPAQKSGWAQELSEIGKAYGQPVNISILQKEDLQYNDPECQEADLRQTNRYPSVQTVRGHQGPAGFMIMGSGLLNHQNKDKIPIKFTHIDMGSCQGEFPHTSYPNPLICFAAKYILPQ